MSLVLILAYLAIMISVYLFVQAIIGFNTEMKEESTGILSEDAARAPWLWKLLFPYIRLLGQVVSRYFPHLSETDLELSKKHKDLSGPHIFIHKLRAKFTQSLIIAGKPLNITPAAKINM